MIRQCKLLILYCYVQCINNFFSSSCVELEVHAEDSQEESQEGSGFNVNKDKHSK